MCVPGLWSCEFFSVLLVMGLNAEYTWDVSGPSSGNCVHGCGMLFSKKQDDKHDQPCVREPVRPNGRAPVFMKTSEQGGHAQVRQKYWSGQDDAILRRPQQGYGCLF